MAESPSHRFGQIVGEVLEAAVLPFLIQFATSHTLYLDKRGARHCRTGSKCSWEDSNGNKHDLDFVLERGGSDRKQGIPAAFIETAWRRYTKHSRNKAQEIQGAIEPLAQTFRNAAPFKGAILAGVFTAGALTQLRSLGFTVLFFPYASVVQAFAVAKIDAAFDETTPDKDLQKKVDAWKALSGRQKNEVASALIQLNKPEVTNFLKSLSVSILRKIDQIVIIPLYGTTTELNNIVDAISYLQKYDERPGSKKLRGYEIFLRYSNGNRIEGRFNDSEEAIAFLRTYI